MPQLSGRDAILAAADHHPLARLRTNKTSRGYEGKGCLVWTTREDERLRACGLGDPLDTIEVCARWQSKGMLPRGSMLELPRVDLAALTEHFDVDRHEYWSVLWTRSSCGAEEDDRLVVPLASSEHAEIEALLAVAFPETHNRPGRPSIRRWFGIYEGDRLVAVGADRSQGGVGFLVAIAVHPDRRGRGYGAAVTRRLVRELLAESDLCALGVSAANERARNLYRRLGFGEGIDLTSITLLSSQAPSRGASLPARRSRR